jgi:hypothetical protein
MRHELLIPDPRKTFEKVVKTLYPYRTSPTLSEEFIVERQNGDPLILLKYPGEKVYLKSGRARFDRNLYDFLVVPCENASKLDPKDLTYMKIAEDFFQYKRQSDTFWSCILEIYQHNTLSMQPPSNLGGIQAHLFLATLKWLWIAEDLNYCLASGAPHSPAPYRLKTNGVGRKKFFAGLVLLKSQDVHFSPKDAQSIVGFY